LKNASRYTISVADDHGRLCCRRHGDFRAKKVQDRKGDDDRTASGQTSSDDGGCSSTRSGSWRDAPSSFLPTPVEVRHRESVSVSAAVSESPCFLSVTIRADFLGLDSPLRRRGGLECGQTSRPNEASGT